MWYPHFIRKWWFCEGESFVPTDLAAHFLLGILWFFVALFFYSYLQQSWLSSIYLKIELLAFVVSFLSIPFMRRVVSFFYLGVAFIFFNLVLGFYFKIGEICLAHIYVGSEYRFSDSLNLPCPDNWIVFGVCLLPLLGVFFTTCYIGADFKEWYEQSKLPITLDLKNHCYRVSSLAKVDNVTKQLMKRIKPFGQFTLVFGEIHRLF